MINEKQTIKISKFLSLVLRHKPETIGIQLDENGWVNTDELIAKMNVQGKKINREILNFVVETNSKKRFAFNEDQSKIRASQGHSLNINLGYQPVIPPEILYHGTGERSVNSILKTGIEKRNRHQVHLSLDRDTAINVGGRHGKPVILEVLSKKMHEDGFAFYLSENKVWLTEFVPPEYINFPKRTRI